MPAMHDTVKDRMLYNLEQKKDIMLRLYPFSMTHYDALRLVAPKEHVELLLSASQIADIGHSREWMVVQVPAYVDDAAGCRVRLRLCTHNQVEPPLRPAFPHWQLPGTPEDVERGGRVINWLEKRLEIGRQFAMCRHVIEELSKLCTTGSQMTYLLPTISHLCDREGLPRMEAWMDKYAAYKPVLNAPALSLPMREATRAAASLLTRVALLGDDVPKPEVGQVEIEAWDMPSVKFEGRSLRRM